MTWRSASGVLFNHRIFNKLREKIYKTVIQPSMLYGIKHWAVKKQNIHKMSVVKMRMLRWIIRNTQNDLK